MVITAWTWQRGGGKKLEEKENGTGFTVFIIQCMCAVCSVAQLCLTLCDPMDYTVHGILQTKILEWVAFPFSRGCSQHQGLNPGLLHCRRILYQLSHKGSPGILEWVTHPFSRGSSRPRNRTGVSCIAGWFFTNWAIREANVYRMLIMCQVLI